jgi:hypothetical protein
LSQIYPNNINLLPHPCQAIYQLLNLYQPK